MIPNNGPDNLLVGGRGSPRTDLMPTIPITVFAEPQPALAPPDREAFMRMLRGGWFWAMRKVHKLRVAEDDRGQYAVRREDVDTAHAVFIEKSISPGVWLAWRAKAFVREPSHAIALGWLLGASLLTEAPRRGWFRRATDGYFGGRAAPTPAQLELMQRWRHARSLWARGMNSEDALDCASLDPMALDALTRTAEGEAENARVRCLTRAGKGDPMPVLPPDLWPFGPVSKEASP